MKVNFNQYTYHPKQVSPKQNVTFKSTSTFTQKLGTLFTDTVDLYSKNKSIQINDFEKIIKKVSPRTTVRNLSEVPNGANINPRTGGYYSNKVHINPITNEIIEDDKVIYLNPDNADPNQKLKLFSDFIHEATHILQQESSDREPVINLTRQFLKTNLPSQIKQATLYAGIKLFSSIEYNSILPLIEALQKESDMPVRIAGADKNILNMIYINKTGLPLTEYIKAVSNYCVEKFGANLPQIDLKYIMDYIRKQAGEEKEAYAVSLKFLKKILNINGDTDLDLRIHFYDEFEKTFKN